MRFDYPGYFNAPSYCELNYTIRPDGWTVIIATEPNEEGSGTSITNMVEGIVERFCRTRPRVDPKRLIWIEHYPERGVPESWDVVSFGEITGDGKFSGPVWTRLPKDQFENPWELLEPYYILSSPSQSILWKANDER